ncbi:rho GTPase-activating protein [Dermatophagoides pteronyssinus]|uniref:Rho GTPase-activating protein n=1 Tax=Dermatophagoides pteronyssinus TaxID=6956 RepID=A0ABQ8IT97_DERPT|nr:rho GTPase-activating protein [Dermatophagoides pteronyssinus]
MDAVYYHCPHLNLKLLLSNEGTCNNQNKTIEKLTVIEDDDDDDEYDADNDDDEDDQLPMIIEQQQNLYEHQNNNQQMIITNINNGGGGVDGVNSIQTSSSSSLTTKDVFKGKKQIQSILNPNAREFLQDYHHHHQKHQRNLPANLMKKSSTSKKIDIHLTPRQQQVIDEKFNTLRQRKQRPQLPTIDETIDCYQFEQQHNNNNQSIDLNNNDERKHRLQSKSKSSSLSKFSKSTPNLFDVIDSESSMKSDNNNQNKKTFTHRLQDRLKRFFNTGSRSSSVQKHKISNEIIGNNDSDGRSVRIKYFKYNASYRKAQRGKHRQPQQIKYRLLEPILLRKDELPSSSSSSSSTAMEQQALLIYENFGVRFIIDQNHQYLIVTAALSSSTITGAKMANSVCGIIFGDEGIEHSCGELAFQQQQSLTYCEDFTKNLAGAVQTLALLELQADINQLQQLFRLSPSMNYDMINNNNNNNATAITNNCSTYIIPMPNFSKNRKTFPSLISKNENRSIIIFGGNLTALHVRDNERNKNDLDVPSILKHMIDYLGENGVKEEGIFRVPGTKNRLNKLEEELTDLYLNYYKLNKPDDIDEINTIFDKYNVHDVASLLKLFIRRLSPPLMTNELMDIFLMIPKIMNIFVKIKILNLLMLTLNDTHRNSLNALLNLSNKVVRFKEYNLITLDGIVTLLAANLFNFCPSPSSSNNRNNNHQSTINGQKRSSISTTIDSIGLPTTYSQQEKRDGSPKSLSSNNNNNHYRRISVSSQAVNEISTEMANQLERTQNSLGVLKLLINLQPILFHIPPYLERQIHENGEKKAQVNKLFNL